MISGRVNVPLRKPHSSSKWSLDGVSTMGWTRSGVNNHNNKNHFFTLWRFLLHANQHSYDLTLQVNNIRVYQTPVWNKTFGKLTLSSSCVQGLYFVLRRCLLKLSEWDFFLTVSLTRWRSARMRSTNGLYDLPVTAWAVWQIRNDKSSKFLIAAFCL